MVWAKNGTPNTLASTSDDCDITDLGGDTFNIFLNHKITSGDTSINYTFNNDSTATYAIRLSVNGGTDGAYANRSKLDFWQELTDIFEVMYAVGISSEEKLIINFTVGQDTAGTGTAPSRREHVAKWVNTSDTINRIDLNNDQSGDYAVGTNMSALGSEGVESMTVQDGAVYYDTDLNKSYVLYNNAWTEL